MNRTRTQDHLACIEMLDLPGALGRHSAHTVAVDPQPDGTGSGHDGQIAAPAHRARQIAACARGALCILAERHRKEAVVRTFVDVGNRAQPACSGDALHRSDEGRPLLCGQSADRVGASASLVVAACRHRRGLGVVAIGIVLELAEASQHIAPAPAVGAGREPGIVIGGQPAQRPQSHHARAPAHDARLREGSRRLAGRPARLQVGPEVASIEIRAREGVGNVGGSGVGRRVVAGLEQEHARGRVFGEQRCEGGAGAAAADDQEIGIVHRCAGRRLPLAFVLPSAGMKSRQSGRRHEIKRFRPRRDGSPSSALGQPRDEDVPVAARSFDRISFCFQRTGQTYAGSASMAALLAGTRVLDLTNVLLRTSTSPPDGSRLAARLRPPLLILLREERGAGERHTAHHRFGKEIPC